MFVYESTTSNHSLGFKSGLIKRVLPDMDYFYGTSPPPEYERYAWIVDAATLVQGLLWALNYGEASYRSIKDRTYGMAIFPLCCNYAWELVYTLIYSSQNKYERIIMTTWLILNSVMMGCAIKFAPNEWIHAPLVKRNIPFIFLAGVAAFVIAQLALAATVGPGLAMNWVAALCYLLLTIGSLCQLMTRGSSRGVSYTMW